MKKRLSLIIFVFILFLFLAFPREAFGVILFEDNFEDGLEKWEAVLGTLDNFVIKDGKVGATALSPFTVFQIVPKSEFWNEEWGDYIVEVDMFGKRGTDKNVVFRFQDLEHWCEIHHGLGDIYLSRVWHDESVLLSVPFPLQNDINYHIKIILQEESIKVFIKNVDTGVEQLVMNYRDEGTPLRKGKIGIRIGSGIVYPSEVWFDNVVVRSLEKTPVVFIPGFGASWNTAFLKPGVTVDWSLNPIARAFPYRNLINSFLNAGHEDGQDFFIFAYDWRKPLNELDDDLAQFLETTVNVPKVNLVGHSMGGLVGRAYLQNYPVNPVGKLISIGSPHEGVVQAYPAWEGAEFWDYNPLVKAVAELLLLRCHQPYESEVQALRRVIPSLKDLLPTFDFLYDKKIGQMKSINAHKQRNETLISLNDSLNQITKDLMKIIYGTGFPTLWKIKIKSGEPFSAAWWHQIADYWEDGTPDCYLQQTFTHECEEAIERSSEGDKTVLVNSATIAGVPEYFFNLEHTELVQDQLGLEKIFEYLNINEPVESGLVAEISEIILFFLQSPAHLTVADPEGKKIGWGVLSEIEGALYDEEGKLIMIPNPKNGFYTATVEGEGEGEYHLLVGQTTENDTNFYEYTGETQSGQKDDLQFNFEEEEAKEALVDPLGVDHLSSAQEVLLNLRPNLPDRKQRDLDRILKDLKRVEREIEKENFSRAARWLERIISRIYSLRRGLDLEKKEELEKAAIDCQAAYLAIVESNKLDVPKFKAGIYLNLAQRYLDRVRGQTKEAALVFLLAQEYLQKAQQAFDEGNFPKTLLYSSIARYLGQEVWRL